jgi:uncharacterized membrane protein
MDRPEISLPSTPLQKTLIAASVITLIFHFAMIAYYWPALPAKIASHYGYFGKPDAWRSKSSIWVLPINFHRPMRNHDSHIIYPAQL